MGTRHWSLTLRHCITVFDRAIRVYMFSALPFFLRLDPRTLSLSLALLPFTVRRHAAAAIERNGDYARDASFHAAVVQRLTGGSTTMTTTTAGVDVRAYRATRDFTPSKNVFREEDRPRRLHSLRESRRGMSRSRSPFLPFCPPVDVRSVVLFVPRAREGLLRPYPGAIDAPDVFPRRIVARLFDARRMFHRSSLSPLKRRFARSVRKQRGARRSVAFHRCRRSREVITTDTCAADSFAKDNVVYMFRYLRRSNVSRRGIGPDNSPPVDRSDARARAHTLSLHRLSFPLTHSALLFDIVQRDASTSPRAHRWIPPCPSRLSFTCERKSCLSQQRARSCGVHARARAPSGREVETGRRRARASTRARPPLPNMAAYQSPSSTLAHPVPAERRCEARSAPLDSRETHAHARARLRVRSSSVRLSDY